MVILFHAQKTQASWVLSSGSNIRVPNGKIEGAEILNLHAMLDLNIYLFVCSSTIPQFVVKCKKNWSKFVQASDF